MNVIPKKNINSMTSNGLHKPWHVLERKDVYAAPPWLTLAVEKVELPDGRVIDDFYHLEIPDFVVIFAETASGGILTIGQYKHGAGQASLTLPSGQVDNGEAPILAAKRELLEETGYQAPSWRHLGSYTVNGNLGCGKGHFFLATKAHQVQEPDSGDLEEMEINILTCEALKKSIDDGHVILLNHIAAITLAFAAMET